MQIAAMVVVIAIIIKSCNYIYNNVIIVIINIRILDVTKLRHTDCKKSNMQGIILLTERKAPAGVGVVLQM